MTLQELMRVPYVDGGREPSTGLDCWGMVRAVRQHVLSLGDLPLLDSLQPGDARSITRAGGRLPLLHDFEQVNAQHGAIALVYQGRVNTHVGIALLIDGMLRILDTDKDGGPKISTISTFESKYTQVKYYEKCKTLPW